MEKLSNIIAKRLQIGSFSQNAETAVYTCAGAWLIDFFSGVGYAYALPISAVGVAALAFREAARLYRSASGDEMQAEYNLKIAEISENSRKAIELLEQELSNATAKSLQTENKLQATARDLKAIAEQKDFAEEQIAELEKQIAELQKQSESKDEIAKSKAEQIEELQKASELLKKQLAEISKANSELSEIALNWGAILTIAKNLGWDETKTKNFFFNNKNEKGLSNFERTIQKSNTLAENARKKKEVENEN